MKRPLVSVAIVYAGGLVLGWMVEAPVFGAFLACFLLSLAALLMSRWRAVLLTVAVFVFGWLNLGLHTALVSPHDLRLLLGEQPQLISMRGRLAQSPSQRISLYRDEELVRSLVELRVSGVKIGRDGWQPAHGVVFTGTPGVLDRALVSGQQVEVNGIVARPALPVAPGVFDFRTHLERRGITFEVKVESPHDWRVLSPVVRAPLATSFRWWAQRTLARGLPSEDEALRLQWAMILGWKTALTGEVAEPFMRSGTMHIFAISGLHIALIAGIVIAVLRAMNVPRLVCGLIVVPLIWFYTAATDWQASAVRSSLMMTVVIGGWALHRPGDLVNSLAAAACMILVWDPLQLFQAGFQLSFFVVLSIALLVPMLDRVKERCFRLDPMLPLELRPRWQRWSISAGNLGWRSVAASLAAFIGSAPLIAHYFHLFTPVSLLANVLVVPASALALASGLAALVTGDLVPAATELFNHSGWFWMRLMVWFSESAASMRAGWFHVPAPPPAFFCLYYTVLLGLLGGWMRHRVPVIVVAVAALLFMGQVGWQWREARNTLRVTVLPLGGGMSVFAQPPRGDSEWLINCGDASSFGFVLKPFLQSLGCNRVENLLLTHGDARQCGAGSQLIDFITVRQTVVSPIRFRSPKYRQAIDELEVHSPILRTATNGARLAGWTVLHPEPGDQFAKAGDNAVVLMTEFAGARLLLLPDLGRAGQNALVTRHSGLTADIVIAGLPAGDEPLHQDLIRLLQPKLIVIVDSDYPATRRASASLHRRLRNSGVPVLFTREAGAILLTLREGGWTIDAARPVSAIERARERGARGARDE